MTANSFTSNFSDSDFFSAHTVAPAAQSFSPEAETTRLLADKLIAPEIGASVKRNRLHERLSKSSEQFNATLVCGRAGTGKTALVADFAKQSGRATAWYTIESGDCDWRVFANYLANSFERHRCGWQTAGVSDFVQQNDCDEVWQTTEFLGGWLAAAATEKPLLVVLDDAHCVFDAKWFGEFFQTLLPLLGADAHLIMLSRSLPPIPLWRMRSKQVLGVIGENELAFTPDEAVALFADYNLSPSLARLTHRETYGRAAKIKQTAETFSAQSANWVL